MKQNYKLKIFFKILLSFIIVLFYFTPSYSFDVFSSYDSLKQSLESLYNFVKNIYIFINTITSILGLQVILMLIITGLISSALKNIGIEKGKFSFFVSLLLADILWYMWGISFKYELIFIFLVILKTNIIITLPYFIYKYYKNNKLKINYFIKYKLFNKSKISISKKELINIFGDISKNFYELQNSIINDFNFNNDNDIVLSNQTKHNIKTLKEKLQILEGDLK